jgi:hypothetical protein
MTVDRWCHGLPPQGPHAVDVSVEVNGGARLCPDCFRRWIREDHGRKAGR